MILFVDEEPTFTNSHREELEFEKYEVVLKQSVDDAWSFLNEEGSRLELLILDIMMPPSKLTGIDEDGMHTGMLFFEKVRSKFPTLPVLIFTNRSDAEASDYFENKPQCWFLRKSDYVPFQLVEKIKEVLGSAANVKGV